VRRHCGTEEVLGRASGLHPPDRPGSTVTINERSTDASRNLTPGLGGSAAPKKRGPQAAEAPTGWRTPDDSTRTRKVRTQRGTKVALDRAGGLHPPNRPRITTNGDGRSTDASRCLAPSLDGTAAPDDRGPRVAKTATTQTNAERYKRETARATDKSDSVRRCGDPPATGARLAGG
jgi:hypothetical protein